MCRLLALPPDQPVTADLRSLGAPRSLPDPSRAQADGASPAAHDESAGNAA